MFFTKFFYFCKGYVIISLKGFSIERFINICIKRGIHILDIEKRADGFCVMKLSDRDFKKIRPVAYKTKTKVRVIKKVGIYRLFKRYRKRAGFPAGLLFFLLFFAVTSQFVWKVEVRGTDRLDRDAVYEVLKQGGIKTGIWKGSLPAKKEIKELLTRELDNVSWAWMYLEGTKVTVEIHENGEPPKVEDASAACDIVAARTGLIRKVMVKEGVQVIPEGDACLAGDVIIAGTVQPGEDKEYFLVHAQGSVEAQTYHEASGEYKLYREIVKPYGKAEHKISLELFSHRFDLFFKPVQGDTQEQERVIEPRIGNYYPGIKIYDKVVQSVQRERYQIPYDTAVESARRELQAKIAKELMPGAVLTNEEITTEQIDEETIKVTLSMEFTEKIGVEKPIEQPEAPEVQEP